MKMKINKFILVIVFILSISVLVHSKDKRANIIIKHGVNGISISPSGIIWLVTASGETYFTNGIDSNWHYGNLFFEGKDNNNFSNPIFKKISFFNSDTALLTGDFSSKEKKYNKNGYYQTKDGGKTWNLFDYGGKSKMYNIHINKEGHAWMGGLKRELYYSNDFGTSWKTISMPYKLSDRTYGIFMTDSLNGIASSEHNEIITTSDNWKEVIYLQTPYDQKKYKPYDDYGYTSEKISKIILWDKYIVVNQNGHIFYSDTNNIEWNSFQIGIKDFEIDYELKNLYAVTDSLNLIKFSTPTKYNFVNDVKLPKLPINFKVHNNSVYLVCSRHEVYKIDNKSFTKSNLLTFDKKISDIDIIRFGEKLTWGIKENHIYLSEGNSKDWYRENELDFYISDIYLLNDSSAVLWGVNKQNFLYSLKNHTYKSYNPSNPIQEFLKYPLKTIRINTGSYGCYHSEEYNITYDCLDNKTFSVRKKSAERNNSSTFNNSMSSYKLIELLNKINKSPLYIPSIQEFNITEYDKKSYITLVDNILKYEKNTLKNGYKLSEKDFYNVLDKIDKIDDSVIEEVLKQDRVYMSLLTNWFKVKVINQINDTLNISNDLFTIGSPWNLPWEFEFKGQHFNCYDIEFSRYIDESIPKDFMNKEVFDNKYLIKAIAEYLYKNKK